MPPPPEPEEDAEAGLTESGRPRVPRPMPDVSHATQCPHCGADVGSGHYLCWNCSRDIRMKERTEDEIMSEYQVMLAREEVRLETRNRTFYVVATVVAGILGVIGTLMGYWGFLALFLIFAAIMARFWLRSKRREKRIRNIHTSA